MKMATAVPVCGFAPKTPRCCGRPSPRNSIPMPKRESLSVLRLFVRTVLVIILPFSALVPAQNSPVINLLANARTSCPPPKSAIRGVQPKPGRAVEPVINPPAVPATFPTKIFKPTTDF